jgi:hypothetical protein
MTRSVIHFMNGFLPKAQLRLVIHKNVLGLIARK